MPYDAAPLTDAQRAFIDGLSGDMLVCAATVWAKQHMWDPEPAEWTDAMGAYRKQRLAEIEESQRRLMPIDPTAGKRGMNVYTKLILRGE